LETGESTKLIKIYEFNFPLTSCGLVPSGHVKDSNVLRHWLQGTR